MYKPKKKKRPITLLEIMIVIFLIGIIGSVVGYNVKGSLDEGRAFRSEQGAVQIRDILLLEVAKGASVDQVVNNKEKFLQGSGLVKNVEKLLKDGWGLPYEISTIRNGTDVSVKSVKLRAYQKKKKEKLGELAQQVEEEENDDEF